MRPFLLPIVQSAAMSQQSPSYPICMFSTESNDLMELSYSALANIAFGKISAVLIYAQEAICRTWCSSVDEKFERRIIIKVENILYSTSMTVDGIYKNFLRQHV